MGHITVPGALLTFDEWGAGDPIVLVHGTGAQASSWAATPTDLAASGHRVLAYDRRGYGRSAHRPVRDYRVARGRPRRRPRRGRFARAGARVELGRHHRARPGRRPPGAVPVTGDRRGAVARAAARHAGPAGRARARQGRRSGAGGRGRRGVPPLGVGSTRRGNGFDALAPAARAELLGNRAPVLAELDPHPLGLMTEHIPAARLATIPVPVTWLRGAESRDWYGRRGRCAGRIAGAGHLAHLDAPREFAAAILGAVRS